MKSAAQPTVTRVERQLRERIESGDLTTGDRLPTRAELATQLEVGASTVAEAIRRLREAGYVTTGPSGVYVAERGARTVAGGSERAQRSVSHGKIYPDAEAARIVSAEVIPAPEAAALGLGIEVGAPVIRRERVTLRTVPGSAPVPVTWSISWIDGELADVAPELAQAQRIPGGTAGLIAARTGRVITSGCDRLLARAATEAEAAALGIEAGAPVMVGATTWSDADGTVIEWGEWVTPPGRELVHSYRIESAGSPDSPAVRAEQEKANGFGAY